MFPLYLPAQAAHMLWNKCFHVSLPLQLTKPMFQAPILNFLLTNQPAHPDTHTPGPCAQHHYSHSSGVGLPLASSSTPLCIPSPEFSLPEPQSLGPYGALSALGTSYSGGYPQGLSKFSAGASTSTRDNIYSTKLPQPLWCASKWGHSSD